MCGYARTEKGYESLVAQHVATAKRFPAVAERYREEAREILKHAQKWEQWMLNYDPVTCEPKPVSAKGMKVVLKLVSDPDPKPKEDEKEDTPARQEPEREREPVREAA